MSPAPSVQLPQLPAADLICLCALKLMVEVEVAPLAAFEVAEASCPRWRLDYLASGPGLIGSDPVDAACLGRARAWQVEVGRQRRIAQLRGESLPQTPVAKVPVALHNQTAWREPRIPSSMRPISALEEACEAFEALAHAEAAQEQSMPEWIDVSDVLNEVSVRRTLRPSRPDSVIVRPVERPAGFVPVQDPWALPLEVTATQMHIA